MRVLEIKDILSLLRSEVNQAGSISAWSRKTGVNRVVVTRVLSGAEPLTKSIVKALKLRMVLAADEESRGLTARSFFAVQDVISLLRSEIKRTGTISAWCRKTGVNRTNVSKALNGKGPPTPTIIKALKLREVIVAVD
jgi:DNA-binding phage protein